MDASAVTLLTIGAILEFLGILVIAWPDLVPWRERASEWLRRTYGRAADRFRRIFGLRPRGRMLQMSGVSSAEMVGRGSLTKSVGSAATLEQKVAFLLQRDEEAQRDVNALTSRVLDLEEGTRKQIHALRGELTDQFKEKLDEAIRQDRPLRIFGAFLLGAGLTLTTLANFA